MAKRHQLQAQPRAEKNPRALRRAGTIPGVLYGPGVKAKKLQLDSRNFTQIFQQAGHTSLINLSLDDKEKTDEHTVLIREVQYHPVKSTILHADFYQVRMDQTIRARVPLVFTGEAPAVRDHGGVLVRSLDEVELEALPKDLPHDIEVKISGLDNFDKIIRIKDLKLPPDVTLFHESDEVVSLVQAPRTEAELEELAEEVTEDLDAVEGVEETEEESESEGEEEKPEDAEASKQPEQKKE